MVLIPLRHGRELVRSPSSGGGAIRVRGDDGVKAACPSLGISALRS